ncbi:hypothetical protein G6F46_006353 [Rhizopus delemar]|uniref:FCP1 homology domain-containing protein n=2 Tax=Rhizopus TaxID=4842 RepID=A0A9P6YVK6_9FUNG|nr:hypothetical protein G6F43_008783 [Rhizopus delemar]KAG1541022.1 hypothetical protein G6F51_008165 [Rhizopus arrhizus]KAG1451312.1 hypothetical protein G6F55_009247 [Rhizopus delemar]KAG1491763.1 hypothetical protein G6F54_009782 [Rhizopus delemar]KAG1510973.1 hypothetical protein G6F53_006280 [Rhizopus delemar]
MSQTETAVQSETKSNNSNNVQVVPQQRKKGKKQIDPEYVKSPVQQQQQQSNHASGSSSSRSSSLKAFQKGGFLSLLLCCTVGAGSFLDNSNKSTLNNKKNRNSSKQINMDQKVPSIKEEESVQEQQVLDTSSTHIIKNIQPTDTPPIPSPISPQSSKSPVAWLLPPLSNEDKEKKCLVLDLDETLVHSSFKIIPNPDFIVPVEIDNQFHNVYVLKRPGVDEFMRKMGEKYEVVVFTASLAKYADPVLDMLDVHKVVKHRLFRESCFNHKGTYVKDLSQLGRDLSSTLILDNSPASYIFHTSNAVPVSTWFNDPHDTELTDLVAFLDDLTMVDDVQSVLDNSIYTSTTTA